GRVLGAHAARRRGGGGESGGRRPAGPRARPARSRCPRRGVGAGDLSRDRSRGRRRPAPLLTAARVPGRRRRAPSGEGDARSYFGRPTLLPLAGTVGPMKGLRLPIRLALAATHVAAASPPLAGQEAMRSALLSVEDSVQLLRAARSDQARFERIR